MRNARLGLDPWSGLPVIGSSTAMVPYSNACGNNMYPCHEIGNGLDGAPVDNSDGANVDPAPSPNSMEVGAITSRVMHIK